MAFRCTVGGGMVLTKLTLDIPPSCREAEGSENRGGRSWAQTELCETVDRLQHAMLKAERGLILWQGSARRQIVSLDRRPFGLVA
jgi:hypothetical protein